MKILIIGGSRFVGPVLVKDLLANKHEITLFNRGTVEQNYPTAVKYTKGDRDQGFGITEHFDAVIDMCAYTGEQTKAALDQLNYDYFLHFGTVSSYKKTSVFPLTEESPSGEWPFMGDYGKGKVECEEVLAASGKQYASIRPTYVLGPNNYMDRENFIYQKIHKGEPIIIPGNGESLTQFVFAQDIASIIVMLVENKLTGAFNCNGDEMITLNGLVEYMASLVGKPAVIQHNPAVDGEKHDEDEFPFANENVIMTNQKLKDLGYKFMPLLDSIKQDFESYYKKQLS